MATVTGRLAEFVSGLSFQQLPDEVVRRVKVSLIHNLGVGIASFKHPDVQKIRRAVLKAEGFQRGGNATVWAYGDRISPPGAALINGFMCHHRVQDDTLMPTHTGSVIIPAALALIEAVPCTGNDLITALVAGYEVATALGAPYTDKVTDRGFRTSPVFAVFGATAVAAKLQGLDTRGIANALGHSAGFSAGLGECWVEGTPDYAVAQGMAARCGVLASYLAQADLPAAAAAIEGPFGFLNAFAGTTEAAENIGANLGKKWETLNVAFKPFPIGMSANSVVTATLALLSRVPVDQNQIKSIELRGNPYMINLPGHDNKGPFTGKAQVVVSWPFCVALALVERKVTAAGLDRFRDPEILAIADKATIVSDESLKHALSAQVTIQLKSGERVTERLEATPDTYSFNYDQALEVVRRVLNEEDCPAEPMQKAAEFIRELDRHEKPQHILRLLTFSREALPTGGSL